MKKVQLQDAKVELEIRQGLSHVVINGERIQITREVGVRLVFGESKHGIIKAVPKPVKRGCQSAASKLKLSKSLRRFYASKRRKEKAAKVTPVAAKPITSKRTSDNSKHLNGKHTSGVSLSN